MGRHDPEWVHNIWVGGSHRYYVSELELDVHNDCFDTVRAANGLPRRARLTTNEADVFRHLSQHNGIDPRQAGQRLHTIKKAANRGAADIVVFDFTGNVFSPETGGMAGQPDSGARVIR